MGIGLAGDKRAIRDKKMSPHPKLWRCHSEGCAEHSVWHQVWLMDVGGPIAGRLPPPRAGPSFPSGPLRCACHGNPKSPVLGGGLGLVPLLQTVSSCPPGFVQRQRDGPEPPAGHKPGGLFWIQFIEGALEASRPDKGMGGTADQEQSLARSCSSQDQGQTCRALLPLVSKLAPWCWCVRRLRET